MMAKLKRKAYTDGIRCFTDLHKSSELWIVSTTGALISSTNKVNAIANTPSQNVSNRELVDSSAIMNHELLSIQY